LREGRTEQLAMDDGGVDSREYRARLQSERRWEEHSGAWRQTTVLVKILRGWRRGTNLSRENVTIEQGRSSGFKRAEGDDV
jgi:hypothetical protein